MADQPTKTILEEGSGPNPEKGNVVLMGYTGWLKDTSQPDNKGKKFDSSYDRPGEGFSCQIGVGQVIKGWDLGVVTMKLGEKARLDIPSHLAYGNRSVGNLIPANSDLIFDVHLKQIK
ncbi:FKBP-type peptidyl-prolyl cis-trans isomerase domain-containing protein [Trichoderma breve]|uniref:peptidylprolyl isomerase n=1 Tax=Trichoderma breve TaxID=2034170 RepID=A0A9W9E3A8_9HYPO|nr:FKBP-type peptidyl-prolyl cis-trans isomerase domain-containing protein [Trichoderma breve]KAJ4854902.1 FKBP-type peptidyl-prolyl cis-trans isomerase domain-containing protein [Trichoderma breve]